MNNFPHWVDHMLAIFFLAAIPFYSFLKYPGYFPKRLFSSSEKKQVYLSGSLSLFIMAFIVMSAWILFRRPVTDLGFSPVVNFASWWWLVLLLFLLYLLDAFISLSAKENLRKTVETLKRSTPFVPTQKNELPLYFLLCVSAGVCEEIVYRGYLIAYCRVLTENWSSFSSSFAVLLPALAFSAAHYYQGGEAVLKILVLSIFFGIIFLLSGSLLIVMLLHFMVDAAGGLFTVAYFKKDLPVLPDEEIKPPLQNHES